jgi:hypothetical protein
LPTFYKKKIKYDEPRTLTKAIRKDKYMYEQGQGRESLHKSWKDKKMRSSIRGQKYSNLPSIGMNLIEIDKISMLRGIQERRFLGKKGKTTNPILGMQGRSLVQGLPTQKRQSEDCAQHPRGSRKVLLKPIII